MIEPLRLRDLPAGRYLVEPVDDQAPESYSHGRVIDAKRARAFTGAAA